jgi:predicted transport protein
VPEGYIYILFNRAFQTDHYKIGMTMKTPDVRAMELSSATGIPRPFDVLYEQRVTDCHRAERLLHQRLDQYRPTSNREFFVLPLKAAIRALEDVADEVGRLEAADDAVPPAIHAAPPYSPPNELEVKLSGYKPRTLPKPVGISVNFNDHLAYTSAPLQTVLLELRRKLFALDPSLEREERCTPAQRIAYKRAGGTIFLEVKVQRAAVLLNLVDGACPDPAGFAEDIPESHKWTFKKRIVITDMNALKTAWPFVEHAYRAGF